MGLFNMMKKLSSNDAVKLTQVGKNKATSFSGEGVQYRVLTAINDSGGVATIREIAEETRISESTVEKVVQSLIRSGYVQQQKGMRDEY